MYVYAQLGIHLDPLHGRAVLRGHAHPALGLQPGDLVFFEPSARGPQHEGMYIGGGRFIQAPHTGDVVKISRSRARLRVRLRRRSAALRRLKRRRARHRPARRVRANDLGGESICALVDSQAAVAVRRKSRQFAAVSPNALSCATMGARAARTFWFLTLPALFVAETAGHTLVARLLDPQDRATACSRTCVEDSPSVPGHRRVLGGVDSGTARAGLLPRRGAAAAAFLAAAALPALGFLCQENVEQLVHGAGAG